MGNPINEINPTSTITIDITMAVTGLFIKVSAIIINAIQLLSAMLFFRRACGFPGADHRPFSQVLYTLYHYLLSFLQSIFYYDIGTKRLAEYKPSL
jgi:hypothetical protein